MRALFAVLLVALSAVAAPVPKALKKPPVTIDGYWYLVELNVDGVKRPSLEKTARHWLVEGDRVSNDMHGRPSGRDSTNWTIRDPQRPHLRMWGTFPAVIEADGDTLRACYPIDGRKDLTECKPEKGIAYYVYERVRE
jgi:hypothetical protein